VAKHDRTPDWEQQRQAGALYAEGLMQAEVAARLCVSTCRVRRLPREAGVKPRRGLAGVSAERRGQITSLGGKSAHALGRAHEFTSEEAAAAGAKGARVAHEPGTAYRFTPEEARAARRKGLRVRRARAEAGAAAGE
jgi:hypothetical protein